MSFSSGRGLSSAHGAAPGSMRSLRRPDRKPPPLMDPERERDGRRIVRLFAPYRWRLGSVLVLIVISAGLSMLTPFLLRDVLDNAIFKHNPTLLTELVLAMIGIAVATGVFGVWQTYISNSIGQRVMHDLRAAVYRRLQKMSLAFFTRTRTGEVQSRIANDIGGLDNVVTNTATTIAHECDHGNRHGGRDVPARLAAGGDLARVRAAVRVDDKASRKAATQDHQRATAAACGPVQVIFQ